MTESHKPGGVALTGEAAALSGEAAALSEEAAALSEEAAADAGQRFKTKEVVDLLGISRRQLQYWAQTGLVSPSDATRGGHRRYRFEDLVALKATKRLIDAGVSLQRIRASIEALREALPEVGHPLSELVLVATGDVVLVFKDDIAFEAVSGQEWVFEVAQFQREVEAWRSAADGGARKLRPVRRSNDRGKKGKWSQTA